MSKRKPYIVEALSEPIDEITHRVVDIGPDYRSVASLGSLERCETEARRLNKLVSNYEKARANAAKAFELGENRARLEMYDRGFAYVEGHA